MKKTIRELRKLLAVVLAIGCMTFVGVNSANAVDVTTQSELQDVLNSGGTATVTTDITLTSDLTQVNKNSDYTLSLIGDAVGRYISGDSQYKGIKFYVVTEGTNITENITIRNIEFKDFKSGAPGSAVNITSISSMYPSSAAVKTTIALTDNTFSNNNSDYGGAIYHGALVGATCSAYATSTITNMTGTFTGNYATVSGGAIYNILYLSHNSSGDGKAEIKSISGTFTGNYAAVAGGAIYNGINIDSATGTGAATITLKDVIFKDNYANDVKNDIYNTGTVNVVGDVSMTGGITGTGKTVIAATGTLKLAHGATLQQGSITLNGTLDLANGEIDTITTSGTLTGTGGLRLDLSGSSIDSITVAGGNASGIKISALNLHTAPVSGNYYTYLTNATNYNTDDVCVAIAETTAGYNVYRFENAGGKINLAGHFNATLHQIVTDTFGGLVSKVVSWSITDPTTEYEIGADGIGILTWQGGDPLEVTRNSFTIFGNGGTINGNGNAGITIDSTTGKTVAIEDVTMKGFAKTSSDSSVNGGAIDNSGTITTISGKYTTNHITSTANSAYGGAISNRGTITNINADFTGNTVVTNDCDAYGGAIYNESGTITNINADFDGNTVTSAASDVYGGAIYNNATITNINSDFDGNSTTALTDYSARGGAIYNNADGAITNINSDFTGNYTSAGGNTSQGGAIYNAGTIGDTTNGTGGIGTADNYANFTGNGIKNYGETNAETVTKYGGAIYNAGTITNINADFTDNAAKQQGGAIYNVRAITNLNADFEGNTASNSGGAIANIGTSSTTIGNIVGTFNDNTAIFDGGAIYNEGVHSGNSVAITTINADFTGNTATYKGGAISNYSNDGGIATIGTITGKFEENTAANGGAIYNCALYNSAKSEITLIDNATFKDNYATSDGGAIYNHQDGATATITLKDVTFTNNYIGTKGNPTSYNDILNTGTVNISGNVSMTGGITGNGTTKILSTGKLTLNHDPNGNLATLNQGEIIVENGGIIDLQNGGIDTLNLDNLKADSVVNFNLDFDGTAAEGSNIDKITINGLSGNVWVKVNAIKISTEATAGGSTTATWLETNLSDQITDLTAGTIKSATEHYIYKFEKDENTTGKFNVTITDPSNISLPEIIQEPDYVAISSYSITAETYTLPDNLGTLYGDGRNFTIFGNNHTIDAKKDDDHIYSGVTVQSDQTFALEDVTMTNFGPIMDVDGAKGSVINNSGTVNISGVTFSNNSATPTSGDAYGGVIYNANGATITNINADFDHNTATSDVSALGGAVNNSGTITTISGKYTYNNVTSTTSFALGGAIYNANGATITNINADFTGNYTFGTISSQGGAIYNAGTIGDTTNGTGGIGTADNYANFTGNGIKNYGETNAETVTKYGGAIYNASSKTISAINGKFEDNYTTVNDGFGGAIFNAGTIGYNTTDGGIGTADSKATFTGNGIQTVDETKTIVTNDGGAIYNQGTITNIYADFTGNAAKTSGGAISNSSDSINLISGKFEDNYVKSSGTDHIGGGAISNSDTIKSISADFEGNYAETSSMSATGGAIFNKFGTINSISGDFNGNYAKTTAVGKSAQGGAIYNECGTINLKDATFTGNYADGETAQGGAIYNSEDSSINFSGTNTFTGNYTQVGGGEKVANDIYNAGTIIITGGTTTLNGGMIQDGGRTVVASGANLSVAGGEFKNSVLTSQTDDVYGGAILNAGGSNVTPVTITGTFTSNRAVSASGDAYGGAIENNGGVMNISGTFTGNYVSSVSGDAYGGAIENDGGVMVLSGTFTGNYAQSTDASWGGAIENVNSGVITLNNTTFEWNGYSDYNSEAAGDVKASTAVTNDGGAIYNEGTMNFTGTNTFSNNAATSMGGAIYNEGTMYFTGTNIFENNVIKTGAVTTANDIYNPGIININSGTVSMTGGITGDGTTTVAESATIEFKGGTVASNITGAGKTSISENVTVGEGGQISTDYVDIASGKSLVITGNYASVTLDGGDNSDRVNWAGTVILNNDSDDYPATLILNNISSDKKTGILKALDGNLTIGNGVLAKRESVTLNNSADVIESAVVTEILPSATLVLANQGAKVTLNTGLNTGDTWGGNIEVQSGELLLYNLDKETVAPTDVLPGSTYNQTGGTLKLQGSELTLNKGSKINTAKIDMDKLGAKKSAITFVNGEQNSATIETSDSEIVVNNISDTEKTNLTFLQGTSITGTSTVINFGSLSVATGAVVGVAVVNNGTYNLTDSTITKNITGTGDLFIKGTTTNNADLPILQNSLNLNNQSSNFVNNGTATVCTLNNAGTITGSGSLNLGDGTNEYTSVNNGSIAQTSITNKANSTLKTDATKISVADTNGIINNGTIEITSGSNWTTKVTGTGTVKVNSSNNLKIDAEIGSNKLLLAENAGNVVIAPAYLTNASVEMGADSSGAINIHNGTVEELAMSNLTLNTSTAAISVDTNLSRKEMDTLKVTNSFTPNSNKLILNTNMQSYTRQALKESQISLSPIADGMTEATATALKSALDVQMPNTVTSPIYVYKTAYNSQSGEITLTRSGFSSSIYSASIGAQVGAFLAQVEICQEAFANMDQTMLMSREERAAMKFANKISSTETQPMVYAPNQIPEQSKGLWFRPFANFEKVGLAHGPKVENIAYGSLFGGDSNIIELKHGWDFVWGGYAGYIGSHQNYDNVGIYQNGGTLGLNAFFYKGNFFTGITANVGASVAQASTYFGSEDFTSLMTGVAVKTGYNWELFKSRLIIQPSLLLAYTFVNTFDYTNAAGVKITSDPLNALQIAPGIKFIGNLKNGWQPYFSIQMIWNAMDNTHFYANNAALPQMSVDPYVQYGVGVQKRWGERFSGYLQAMLRNGGRNGVALAAGFRWMVGNAKKDNTPKQEAKVIKDKSTQLSDSNVTPFQDFIKSLSFRNKSGISFMNKMKFWSTIRMSRQAWMFNRLHSVCLK